MASVVTIHLCSLSVKVSIAMDTNSRKGGSILVKLYVPKQAAGHVWPTGYSFLTPDFRTSIAVVDWNLYQQVAT